MARRLDPAALARTEGWEARLSALIEERRHMPFAWGRHDCALFAAAAIEAVSGRDIAEPVRGYRTAAGAERMLRRFGCRDVLDAVGPGGFALPPRHPIDARRGDLVSYLTPLGPTLGVALGEHFAAPGELRLLFLRLDQAQNAWRVG